MGTFAVIAATGRVTDVIIGSAEERTLFRVMPLGGTAKIFFDSEVQYHQWQVEQRAKILAAERARRNESESNNNVVVLKAR